MDMLGKYLNSFRVSTYEHISVLHYFLYTLYKLNFIEHHNPERNTILGHFHNICCANFPYLSLVPNMHLKTVFIAHPYCEISYAKTLLHGTIIMLCQGFYRINILI